MKKVSVLVISLILITITCSAIAASDSWTVSMYNFEVTIRSDGGSCSAYNGELLCAWTITDPATYTTMDYVSPGWLDAPDEPLVAINAPGTLCTMRYYAIDNAPDGAWYVPQNIMDAIGYQPAN